MTLNKFICLTCGHWVMLHPDHPANKREKCEGCMIWLCDRKIYCGIVDKKEYTKHILYHQDGSSEVIWKDDIRWYGLDKT